MKVWAERWLGTVSPLEHGGGAATPLSLDLEGNGIMRRLSRAAVVVFLAGVGVLATAPAQAANTEADFGQHVATCATTMGFDGMHNPGMHHGKSGWDPRHMCPMG